MRQNRPRPINQGRFHSSDALRECRRLIQVLNALHDRARRFGKIKDTLSISV